ncbi:MAG: poly(R)-hydroxyalkanoic acid synthase subunit PhaE [Desulfopila sp.]
MSKNTDTPFDMNTAVSSWLTFANQVWGPVLNQMSQQTTDMWSAYLDKSNNDTATDSHPGAKTQEAFTAALKNWQAMSKAFATPESVEALLKGSGAMPEMLLKLSQTSLRGYWDMQEKMIQKIGRLGKSAEAYSFADLDENIFDAWADVYEKEFRHFFQMPQLGLLRSYQEKINEAADKYAFFQASMSELFRLLGLPFKRSMQVMQEKLAEMAEQGLLPEDGKGYYNLWVKVLEGHFMTLYQTPEYVETLGKTVNYLAEFVTARDAALEDMVGSLPLAKKSDFDELARELHDVKKRLRQLEKSQKAAAGGGASRKQPSQSTANV